MRMPIKAKTPSPPSKVPLKQAFSKQEKVSAELTDEDVLYLNNIVVIYTHLSPIFHIKAILSFIYSLVSEHPHPPASREPPKELCSFGEPRPQVPSPTWRRLICALLFLPAQILRSRSRFFFRRRSECEVEGAVTENIQARSRMTVESGIML